MSVGFVVAVSVLIGLLLFLLQQVRRPAGRPSPWPKRVRVGLASAILWASPIFGLVRSAFWKLLDQFRETERSSR